MIESEERIFIVSLTIIDSCYSYFVCDYVCRKNFENENELFAMAWSIAHNAWCEYSCVMICKLHVRFLTLTHV